jgi:hypothetical protein
MVALTSLIAVIAIGGAGVTLWSGTAGAHSAAVRTVTRGAHRHDAVPRTGGASSGQTGGLIRMTEGGLEMVMTPLSGKAPTWSEIQQVYRTVRTAAAATATYRNLAAARHAGYVTVPDLLVESQGAHYYNPQYLAAAEKGVFDPTHPPFLVYNTMNGRPTLSGLMFYLPESMTPRQLARIFPASMASWHQHINVCVGGGTSLLNGTAILHYYDPTSCAAHGGHFVGNTGWMVHTWIGQANGSGLFAMDMNNAASSGMSDMPGMVMPTPTRSSP